MRQGNRTLAASSSYGHTAGEATFILLYPQMFAIQPHLHHHHCLSCSEGEVSVPKDCISSAASKNLSNETSHSGSKHDSVYLQATACGPHSDRFTCTSVCMHAARIKEGHLEAGTNREMVPVHMYLLCMGVFNGWPPICTMLNNPFH